MSAEQWLRECPFGEWIPIREIPDDIAEDVLNLIDQKFLGWNYYFDDFDYHFKKYLDDDPSQAKLSNFKRQQEQKYQSTTFNESDQ